MQAVVKIATIALGLALLPSVAYAQDRIYECVLNSSRAQGPNAVTTSVRLPLAQRDGAWAQVQMGSLSVTAWGEWLPVVGVNRPPPLALGGLPDAPYVRLDYYIGSGFSLQIRTDVQVARLFTLADEPVSTRFLAGSSEIIAVNNPYLGMGLQLTSREQLMTGEHFRSTARIGAALSEVQEALLDGDLRLEIVQGGRTIGRARFPRVGDTATTALREAVDRIRREATTSAAPNWCRPAS